MSKITAKKVNLLRKIRALKTKCKPLFLDKFKDRAGSITHAELKTYSIDFQNTFIVAKRRVSSDVFLKLKK